MTAIRTLIVDDEPLARQRLRKLLEAEPDIEVIAECPDGESAVAAVSEHQPELVFLDVQMPDLDGFGVLEAVGAEQMPTVIFVTAYDHYALRAFEVHALDYLLKPFDRERFAKALARAKEHVRRGRSAEASRQLLALLGDARPGPRHLERLVLRSGGRIFFLKAEEIDWVEAAGNYLRLHAGGETHLLRETMNALDGRLDPARFVRIHRSTLVNLERIKEIQPLFHGDYVVLLRDGTELTLSRTYRARVEEVLGAPL